MQAARNDSKSQIIQHEAVGRYSNPAQNEASASCSIGGESLGNKASVILGLGYLAQSKGTAVPAGVRKHLSSFTKPFRPDYDTVNDRIACCVQPPVVQFRTRVNMACVDNMGNVLPGKFQILGHWKREYTMENVLLELRREMASSSNRKLSQPPEGTMY